MLQALDLPESIPHLLGPDLDDLDVLAGYLDPDEPPAVAPPVGDPRLGQLELDPRVFGEQLLDPVAHLLDVGLVDHPVLEVDTGHGVVLAPVAVNILGEQLLTVGFEDILDLGDHLLSRLHAGAFRVVVADLGVGGYPGVSEVHVDSRPGVVGRGAHGREDQRGQPPVAKVELQQAHIALHHLSSGRKYQPLLQILRRYLYRKEYIFQVYH